MTQEENMGLDAEERALAERLRLLKLPEPPIELDQRIRAHARAAVLRRPRWGWGMGVAATAVLSAVMLQQTLQNTPQQMLPELAPAATPQASTPPRASEQAELRSMAPDDAASGQPAPSDAIGHGSALGESEPARPDALHLQPDAPSPSASAPREPVGQSGGSSTERRSSESISPVADEAAEQAGTEASSLREAEWAPDPAPSPAVSQDAAKASERFRQPAEAPVAKPTLAAPSPAAELKSEVARKSVAEEARGRAPQLAPAPVAPDPAVAAPPSSVSGRNQPAAPPLRLEVTGSRLKRQADQPEFEFASFSEGVSEVRRLLAEGQEDRALQALRQLHARYPARALPDDLDALLRAAP